MVALYELVSTAQGHKGKYFMLSGLMRFVALVIAMLAVVMQPSVVSAAEKSGTRPGFENVDLDGETVILFRPDVSVGSSSMGSLFEPRADWTDDARRFMDAELERQQASFKVNLNKIPDFEGDDARMVAEYQALFKSVANSIVVHQFFAGNRLPTRKRGAFEWTLGEDTKRLSELTGARYGLFVYTEDHYSSAGKKVLSLFVPTAPPIHVGYAGLVDLETGYILWLNADAQMGGDVRTEEGMVKRVSQLLEDFPGASASATEAN